MILKLIHYSHSYFTHSVGQEFYCSYGIVESDVLPHRKPRCEGIIAVSGRCLPAVPFRVVLIGKKIRDFLHLCADIEGTLLFTKRGKGVLIKAIAAKERVAPLALRAYIIGGKVRPSGIGIGACYSLFVYRQKEYERSFS